MAVVIEGADEFVRRSFAHLRANLVLARERRRVTYRELALRSGMTEHTAYVLIRGQKEPSVRALAKLAHALQVPLSDLHLDREAFAAKYATAGPLPVFRMGLGGAVTEADDI